MSVIIRLQNLPWSANAMDIRNFFRGLSIPEGGVHIVGGEQGDAFIAFSTDEDARQAMMNDGGKIKEVQVKLLLSSRSQMHKVIEAARQSVPILQLQPQPPPLLPPAPPVLAPPAAAPPVAPPPPAIHASPFAPALAHLLHPGLKHAAVASPAAIPGLGSPGPADPPPQPAVIEPPPPALSSPTPPSLGDERSRDRDKDREPKKRDKSDRRRSRSKSRDRDKKDGRRDRDKKDRRDRSRSRDRRRRSRSRDRRDRKRDRKDRSRSRERSRDNDSRRSRDKRESSDRSGVVKKEGLLGDNPYSANVGTGLATGVPASAAQSLLRGGLAVDQPPDDVQGLLRAAAPQPPLYMPNAPNMMTRPFAAFGNGSPMLPGSALRPGAPNSNGVVDRFPDSNGGINDTLNRLQELGNKRNPNAFQGDKGGLGFGRRAPDPTPPFSNPFVRPPRLSRFDRTAPPGCCIRMKNVPTDLGYGDVRRFFDGYFVTNQGIKMINNQAGRRTGVVYVKFADVSGKQEAVTRDGWMLRDHRVQIEHADDDEYDAAIDSFLPVRHASADDAAGGQLATAPAAAALEDSERAGYTVLRLAELPVYVKEHDIMKKFSDYSLVAINLMDCRRTKTRTAYVQFVKPEDAQHVFNLKNQYAQFGRRTVDVTLCSSKDYERAKNEYNGDGGEEGGDVARDDKRDDKREEDGEDEGEEETPAVEAPRDPRQRRPPQQHEEAGALPPQAMFPHPAAFPSGVFPGGPFTAPPNAFPGFPPPMVLGGVGPRPPWRPPPTAPLDNSPADCVLMKGLSSQASDRTILDFFKDAKVVPSRIHLMLDQNGRPSGDCFCEFRSPAEASLAATKHGTELDGRTVSVDLVDRNVVEEALEGPKQDAPHPERPPPFRSGPPFDSRGGFHPRGNFFRGRGAFDRGRGSFDRGALRGRGGFDRGGFDRGGFDRGGYDRGMSRGRGFPRGAPRGAPRGGFNSYNGGGGGAVVVVDDDELPEPEGFGQPGCVVSLDNVPFRAGIDEILEFFGSFELTQDDVIRRFNDRGMPTGDARVCFRTPFDAQRAVKTLNMHPIRDRNISLHII